MQRINYRTYLPQVPWTNVNNLSREAERQAWATCKRRKAGHCINSNFIYAFAAFHGRAIRAVQTHKGFTVWSENIDGVWCRYRAPLKLSYAKAIDAFDEKGVHFAIPPKVPMGGVEFLGFCSPRVITHPAETPEVNKERDERYEQRKREGKITVGERLRAFQAPYVEARV